MAPGKQKRKAPENDGVSSSAAENAPAKSKKVNSKTTKCVEDEPSPRDAGEAPSLVESVCADLGKMKFISGQLREQTIHDLGKEILKGLRPGAGLRGNEDEEATLYKKEEEEAKSFASHAPFPVLISQTHVISCEFRRQAEDRDIEMGETYAEPEPEDNSDNIRRPIQRIQSQSRTRSMMKMKKPLAITRRRPLAPIMLNCQIATKSFSSGSILALPGINALHVHRAVNLFLGNLLIIEFCQTGEALQY